MLFQKPILFHKYFNLVARLKSTASVILVALCILVINSALGQTEEEQPIRVGLMEFQGGYAFPGGDFAERFGGTGAIGIGYKHKTKSNWLIGGEANFLFGSAVREDTILNFMEDDQGFLIGLDGGQYNPILFMRGYRLQITAAKILPVLQANPNSGLVVQLGLGFMQHKIYYDVKQRDILPQINKENVKAYDRLCNGFTLTQFIGYHYMSRSRTLNFKIGLEFTEGLTFNRRSYNYPDTHDYSKQRFDFIFGLKAAWILPFYEKRIVEYNRAP